MPYHNIISTSKKNKAEKVIRKYRQGGESMAILNYLYFLILATFSRCWWHCLLPAPSHSCCGDRARTPQTQLSPSQVSAPECGIPHRSTCDSLQRLRCPRICLE